MPGATPKVTIYSSPTCIYCRDAEKYFKEKGVEFTEKDITIDPDAFEYVIKEVGQAVTPIITINDTVIIGFDRSKIDDALDDASKERSRY